MKPTGKAKAPATAAPVREARIISFVSGKGGVGKTTIVSNLGVILASEFKKRVLLIDGNISTANLGIHLGFIKSPVSIQDLIDDTIKTYQAVYVHRSGLHIIPASLSLEHEQHDYGAHLLAKRFIKIISDISHEYDFILIDGAAGISGEAKAAVAASDEVVVITVPEIPTVTAAVKVVEVAHLLEVPVAGLVVNRVRRNKTADLPLPEIEKACGVPILATIPEDEAVRESTAMRDPVCSCRPRSHASGSLRRLAARMAGAEDEGRKSAGVFERLKIQFFPEKGTGGGRKAETVAKAQAPGTKFVLVLASPAPAEAPGRRDGKGGKQQAK